MFNANEARKTAELNKNNNDDVAHLLNHFNQNIRTAVNKGKLSLDKQTFQEDRFTSEVVTEVINTLKTNGYKVSLTKNNAHQQIIFEVSW